MTPIRWALVAYPVVGFALSVTANLWGFLTGGLTAFVWAGSLWDTAMLLVWWFVVPALAWPVDVFWWLYHAWR